MNSKIYKCEPSDEYYFREGCYILEMLRSAENPSLSIARARVRPGVRTRLHALKDTAEHYIIQSGEGLMFLGDDTAGKVVTTNDVVLIQAEIAQAIENTGEEDLVFLAVCTPGFEPDCYIDLEEEKPT